MSKDNTNIEALRALIEHEHQIINSYLDVLQLSKKPQEQLNWLKQNAILKHQFNEERLIFSKLLNNVRLKEGGPLCVLYFDEHVINPPAEVVKKIIHKDLVYCPYQSEIKKKQSPLNIPLEEHVALGNLLTALLQKPNEELVQHLDLFKLQDLFHKHHEKEEKCFMKVCESLLIPRDVDEILSLWQPLSRS